MAETALDTSKLGIQNLSSTEVLDLFDEVSTSNPEDVKKKEPKKEEKKPEVKKSAEEEDEGNEKGLDIFGKAEEDEEESKKPEKKEEETDDTEADTTNDTVTDTEESPFPSYAKDLQTMGIFTLDEDEEEIKITGPQDFAERWEYEASKAASSRLEGYLQSKGQDRLEWFDAVYEKGLSPRQYMQAIADIEDFSQLDLGQQINQEKVVREVLKDQGLDPEDIDAEVTKLANIGELEATSQRYHKALIKKQAAKIDQMKQDAVAKERQKVADRENYRVSLTQLLNTKLKEKEFDGIPLTPAVANEVFDSLYNYKYTLSSGEQITQFDKDIIDLKSDPALKLKISLLLNMVKKDPTLSALKKKMVSKEGNELFSKVAQKQRTIVKKEIPVQEPSKFW